jgi:hypothetical protein
MEGSGKMLVTAVGLNSQSGIIFSLLGLGTTDQVEQHEEPRKAPLEGKFILVLVFRLLGCTNLDFSYSSMAKERRKSQAATYKSTTTNMRKSRATLENIRLTDKPKDKEDPENDGRSVLQIKLTKLALAIGYGGKYTTIPRSV